MHPARKASPYTRAQPNSRFSQPQPHALMPSSAWHTAHAQPRIKAKTIEPSLHLACSKLIRPSRQQGTHTHCIHTSQATLARGLRRTRPLLRPGLGAGEQRLPARNHRRGTTCHGPSSVTFSTLFTNFLFLFAICLCFRACSAAWGFCRLEVARFERGGHSGAS